MKAAGTVVKKLGTWLVAKGYTKDDESVRDLVGVTARDLPASQTLLDRLDDWVAGNAPDEYTNEVEGHFLIKRVEPGRIWLEPLFSAEREFGPIPLPEKITRACKVGWDVGGTVGKTARGWRLVEVWNISP